MYYPKNKSKRRYVQSLSAFSGNGLNLKSPFLAIVWSFTFAGYGHFYVNNFFVGMVLMTWEYIANTFSRLNLSIYYTFLGQFEMAKNVVNLKWFLAYGPLYIFCMWDSYRRAVELNRQYLLVSEEDEGVAPFTMNALEINFLEKKNPLTSVGWSLFMPGASQVYMHKLPSAIFGIFWLGVVAVKSNLLTGMMYSLWGDFAKVKEILDPQWFLFLPSIYGFSMYEAYENAVEATRTFKAEQKVFLRNNYQHDEFVMPL